MDKDEEIRTIAYGLWESGGCLHGHDVENWCEAERIWELRNARAAAPRKSAAKTARAVAPQKNVTKKRKAA